MIELEQKEKDEIYNTYINGGGVIGCVHKFHHSAKLIKRVLSEYGIIVSKTRENEYSNKKPDGYWNNKERCEEVAKTCRNRSEFSKKYLSAYLYSKNNGWLNDFDKYFNKIPLFIDYNKKIHLIYVYEIKSEHAAYIGRTTNLKRRDTSHRKDFDTLHNFCLEHNTIIPYPLVLESKLNAEESQDRENYWVNEYLNNGWNIINKAKTGKGSSSLGATNRKWTYDTCAIAASECSSKSEYRKKYPTASRVSIQNKWLNDFFDNIKKPDGYYLIFNNCLEECKKFNSIKELRNKYPFLYHTILKNKWVEMIKMVLKW